MSSSVPGPGPGIAKRILRPLPGMVFTTKSLRQNAQQQGAKLDHHPTPTLKILARVRVGDSRKFERYPSGRGSYP